MKRHPKLLCALLFFVCAAALPAASVANAPAARPFAASFRFDEFDELIKTTFELYQQKKYDEALAAAAKAAALRPQDFRPPALSGLVLMEQWKLQSASDSFAKAIALKPDEKHLYLFKARADRFRNAFVDAAAAAQKAIELDPNFAEAYLLLGDVLSSDEKRRSEAAAAYQTALKLNPQIFDAYLGLGHRLMADKKEKEAEQVFRQAMAADPKRMAGRFDLGRMLVKQGRLKEARVLWDERASDKDNTFPNFITVLERAERLERAGEALRQKPNDPETIVQMGLAVMDGDSWVVDRRQERAIEHFRKALALSPGFVPAQAAIVKAYIQLADTFDSHKKNVDAELAKLRKLDAKAADEMENYRKTYSGGLRVLKPLTNR